jgi:hypothetical protein
MIAVISNFLKWIVVGTFPLLLGFLAAFDSGGCTSWPLVEPRVVGRGMGKTLKQLEGYVLRTNE